MPSLSSVVAVESRLSSSYSQVSASAVRCRGSGEECAISIHFLSGLHRLLQWRWGTQSRRGPGGSLLDCFFMSFMSLCLVTGTEPAGSNRCQCACEAQPGPAGSSYRLCGVVTTNFLGKRTRPPADNRALLTFQRPKIKTQSPVGALSSELRLQSKSEWTCLETMLPPPPPGPLSMSNSLEKS